MRQALVALMAALALGCGPKPGLLSDGGVEDAGVDGGVDAGRPRGDDPPAGWQTAVATPAGAGATVRLGLSVASAADQFSQPLIAGVFDDPNGDGQRDDSRVFFTRWDGVARAFASAQVVEVVGAIDLSHPHRQVSVARDGSTGQLGVAYVKGTDTVRLATSGDEGANFTLEVANDRGLGGAVSDPQLALAGGATHLAYFQGATLRYRTRTGSGAFSELTAPLTSGMDHLVPGPLALAVDSQGHAGLAYFEQAAAAATASLVFWRPGGAATVVADSGAVDVTTAVERRPSVALTFVGETASLSYHLRQVEPLASADDTTELWYARALDVAGATWGAAAPIPRNGNGVTFNSTRWYQAVVAEQTGRVAVAADFAAQGIVGGQCGGPKLARSADGASFLTCAPAATPLHMAGAWISMWSHAPGKLTLVFFHDVAVPPLSRGVQLWREP